MNNQLPIKIIPSTKPIQPIQPIHPIHPIQPITIQQQNIQKLPNQQNINQSPIKQIKPYVAPQIKIDFPENPTEEDKKNLVQRFNSSIQDGKPDEAMEIMLVMIKNDIRVRE